MTGAPGPLGDTPARDYHATLSRFARFIEPELRALVDGLDVPPAGRVLDAGCGPGLAAGWLGEQVGPGGSVVACDLSHAHCVAARDCAGGVRVVQADFERLPFVTGQFDLIWSMNAVNHCSAPDEAVRRLAHHLRPGGRLVVVQTGLLSELVFAWDWRLERLVQDACYRYYRDKYGLTEHDTAAGRNLIGWMQAGALVVEDVRTVAIERTAPLSDTDREYLQESLFNGFWGAKLEPYLPPDDWRRLRELTDPVSPTNCLDRPDFHYVQTLTAVTGRPVTTSFAG